jgi:glycosyltransferase involved in cell wall biosynthesis
MAELAALLRRDRIDILHSFLFKANAYAWPAHFLAGVPHLVTSVRSCNRELGWLETWVNRFAFWSSAAVVCNGDAVRSFVAQHFRISIRKSIVIHNGIDLDRFLTSRVSPASKEVDDGTSERRVITVARLVPEKDIELFIEAAKSLCREYGRVRFVVVGDGPCRSDLLRRVSQAKFDQQISFLGERDDVPQLLLHADVFWLTSEWEGLPNALLEAMACGKPVIARDVGACREVINHGINGFLVSGRDARQFSEYTQDLLTNPPRLREMGLAGRKLVEDKFSVVRMARATEALYRSVLDSPIGAARDDEKAVGKLA